MRFKALRDGVELPEKASVNRWINVRANERISVCHGDQVRVDTGVHVTVAKNETARLVEPRALVSNAVEMDITTGELFVTIYNPNAQNFKIHPGQVLAEILVEKQPVKARKVRASKPRKMKLTSKARVVPSEK